MVDGDFYVIAGVGRTKVWYSVILYLLYVLCVLNKYTIHVMYCTYCALGHPYWRGGVPGWRAEVPLYYVMFLCCIIILYCVILHPIVLRYIP